MFLKCGIVNPCSREKGSQLDMVGSNMSSDTRTIKTDVALSLVTDRRRREVLRYLIEADDDAVSLDDLVDEVVTEEAGPPDSSRPTRKQVAVTLQHSHLPMLDDAGVVEYDTRSDTVRYYPCEFLEDLVHFLSERQKLLQ